MIYQVIVRDSTTKYLTKNIEAGSEDQAKELAEEQSWTPEDGWQELQDCEAIIECCVDAVYPVGPSKKKQKRA